jgi:hypothetical protein
LTCSRRDWSARHGCEIIKSASEPFFHADPHHIDFGPATIHHASVNDGCAVNIRERYLDLLDGMSETLDVLAFGDLQRSASREEERELVIDMPRLTPRRLLTASA